MGETELWTDWATREIKALREEIELLKRRAWPVPDYSNPRLTAAAGVPFNYGHGVIHGIGWTPGGEAMRPNDTAHPGQH